MIPKPERVNSIDSDSVTVLKLIGLLPSENSMLDSATAAYLEKCAGSKKKAQGRNRPVFERI